MLKIEQNKYKSKYDKNSLDKTSTETIRQIEFIAKSTGRKRNQVIRMCLEFELDNLEVKDNAER